MTIVLILILVLALTGSVIFIIIREQENRSRIKKLQEIALEAENNTALAEAKNVFLQRFEHIPGIIEKAKRINEEIAQRIESANRKSEVIIAAARKEAERIESEARSKGSQILGLTKTDALRLKQLAQDQVEESLLKARNADDVARGIQLRAESDAAELMRRAKSSADQIIAQANLEAKRIIGEANTAAANVNSTIRAEIEAKTARADELMRRARASADQIIAQAKLEAERIIAEANTAAANVNSTIRAEIKAKTARAESALDRATVLAQEIIEKAEQRAHEIAGKAYESLKKSEFYEKSADAMHNVTKGYGNRFMVPSESILDSWAEEYGFHEIGEKLKAARERTRIMERNRTAASCDYVEASRREMAINFVVDAFNGKADSILSRIKKDNFGTLKKELQDAFALVNFNGKAFRDAHINEGFLDARIDELKWGAEMHRLREKDREEQRAIRERIRDEERAKREYDRAIKQSQREEQLLKKAMNELQKKYEFASLEDRRNYEERITELSLKLDEAVKNQRKLTVAQEKKEGNIYIISNIGSFGEGVYKIGMTRREEPLERVRELGDASVPFPFDVHAMIKVENAPTVEHQLHRLFVQSQVNKVNPRKEFFRVQLSEIRAAVEQLELNSSWTLTAEAREYRETLLLEEALKKDANYRERWVERQLELELQQEHEDEERESDSPYSLVEDSD